MAGAMAMPGLTVGVSIPAIVAVVAQVALAAILLLGMMGAAFRRVATLDPGDQIARAGASPIRENQQSSKNEGPDGAHLRMTQSWMRWAVNQGSPGFFEWRQYFANFATKMLYRVNLNLLGASERLSL
jgi:hypothetical protein